MTVEQLSLLPSRSVAHARAADPDTSHQAAARVRDISEAQAAIIRLFKSFGPMCDEKLVRIYERFMREQPTIYPLQSPSGIRSRRAELTDPAKCQPPKIVYTGEKTETTAGRSTRIWTLASEAWRGTR